MNYSPPDQVPVCPCRDRGGLAPMFCPTGHLLECHYPLTCDVASCGHLPNYRPDRTREQVTESDQAALATLQHLAAPDCLQCQGAGASQVSYDMPFVDGQTITLTAKAICPCVAGIPQQDLPDLTSG